MDSNKSKDLNKVADHLLKQAGFTQEGNQENGFTIRQAEFEKQKVVCVGLTR